MKKWVRVACVDQYCGPVVTHLHLENLPEGEYRVIIFRGHKYLERAEEKSWVDVTHDCSFHATKSGSTDGWYINVAHCHEQIGVLAFDGRKPVMRRQGGVINYKIVPDADSTVSCKIMHYE